MIGLVWSEGHTTALRIGNSTTTPVQRKRQGTQVSNVARADEKKYILIPVVENRVLNKTST